MITSSARGFRRLLALPAVALLVFLSVAVPMLDGSEDATRLVLEQEHDPSSCPVVHHHSICTQVGANLALSVAGVAPPVGGAHASVRRPRPSVAPRSDQVQNTRRSRAPPTA